MAQKNASMGYQYPYPPEPRSWGQEERQFSNGLRRLFDILFSKKLQNVLIADGAVNGRTIAKESIALRHLVPGFGENLDISENAAVESLENTMTEVAIEAGQAQSTADSAVTAAAVAQSTADGAVTAAGVAQSTADTAVSAVSALPGNLFPVGTIVMMDSAPSFGSWESFELGIQDVTAWKRVG